ncbi:MAG: GlxA family transcriptional regulator [Phycicoccus sp.]
MRHPRHVVLVVPDRAHLMDVAGPAQVFVSAAEAGGAYTVTFVAADVRTRTHQGLAVETAVEWPSLAPSDLVLVAGWKATSDLDPLAPRLLDRIAGHWERGGAIASVCAGALALARIGILAGHHATTHHDLVDDLTRYPGVTVVRDRLYTCSGRLHTSAGVASGIDLALHLVAHDHGPALAARVARTLVVPAWRPGAASQASVMLVSRDHLSDLTHRAQDLLDDPDRAPTSLAALAGQLGVSGRTLSRHFVAATGVTPHAYATAVRRDRAAQLRSQGWTQHAAAAAVGYADPRSLRLRRGSSDDGAAPRPAHRAR